MMKIYQVDAFVADEFRGNTAGVCLLKEELLESQMVAIAREMGFAETAFVVPQEGGWHIRWFTPVVEVDLCGHATLAAGWVLSEIEGQAAPFHFFSRGGHLVVSVDGDYLTLDFPAQSVEAAKLPDTVTKALALNGAGGAHPDGAKPYQAFRAQVANGNWLIALESQGQVLTVEPDFELLRTLPEGGVIVTAPGEECDFVSRFFAPNYGIDEDHVTGSAHCSLAPFWAEKLGKDQLLAHQLSERGGEILCTVEGDRVYLRGQARLRTVRQLSGSFFTNEFIEQQQ